jgi:sulfite reductase (NADPH) flavoprotein alpha-component
MPEENPSTPASAGTSYSRKNPYLAEMTRHEHLTGPGSQKDTRHFVLALGDSGLKYTPGDSLGIFARNPRHRGRSDQPAWHDAVTVKTPQSRMRTLRDATQDYILNRANQVMSALAEQIPQGEQRNRIMEIVNNSGSSETIYSRDYVDILKIRRGPL